MLPTHVRVGAAVALLGGLACSYWLPEGAYQPFPETGKAGIAVRIQIAWHPDQRSVAFENQIRDRIAAKLTGGNRAVAPLDFASVFTDRRMVGRTSDVEAFGARVGDLLRRERRDVAIVVDLVQQNYDTCKKGNKVLAREQCPIGFSELATVPALMGHMHVIGADGKHMNFTRHNGLGAFPMPKSTDTEVWLDETVMFILADLSLHPPVQKVVPPSAPATPETDAGTAAAPDPAPGTDAR